MNKVSQKNKNDIFFVFKNRPHSKNVLNENVLKKNQPNIFSRPISCFLFNKNENEKWPNQIVPKIFSIFSFNYNKNIISFSIYFFVAHTISFNLECQNLMKRSFLKFFELTLAVLPHQLWHHPLLIRITEPCHPPAANYADRMCQVSLCVGKGIKKINPFSMLKKHGSLCTFKLVPN